MRVDDVEDPKIVYLNNAGMARLHPDAQQAGIRAMVDPMHYNHDTEEVMVSSIRTHFATLIGVSSDTIAIMPSTAFALTLAAHNLEAQLASRNRNNNNNNSGGQILVLQDQMCSAVYPWQDVCDRSGGRLTLEIVPYPDSTTTTWTQRVLQRLEIGSVAVACLPPLHWSDGALLDLVRIGAVCRSRQIFLVVDATQGVGAMLLSVPQIRPSLLACSVHKWLRGPSGTALVYIDPALHESWSPLDQHGRGRDLRGDSDTMGPHGYPGKFFNDARKFDSGGKPNSILLPMLQAALEHVVALDRAELQKTLQEMMQPFLDWVRSSGKFTLPAAHVYHLIGIHPVDMTPDQMIGFCNRLQKENGIYIAVRCGSFRISPYSDNTTSDIAALLEAFKNMTP